MPSAKTHWFPRPGGMRFQHADVHELPLAGDIASAQGTQYGIGAEERGGEVPSRVRPP